MQNIVFYSFTENKPKDKRKVTGNEAVKIIDEYRNNLKAFYEDPDKALEDSLFGFSYSKTDFIEICIDTKDTFRIKLECKYKRSFWFLSWNSLFQKEFELNNIEELKLIVIEFFNKDIDAFKSYFNSLKLKISPPMIMS
jgi:hypothetical protein